MQYQQNNKPLIETAKLKKDYSIKHFNGADKKYSHICIVFQKSLKKQLVEWYYNASFYPGETHTELSIALHFYWKNLRKTEHEVCSKCKQYGKLEPKEAESKLRYWLPRIVIVDLSPAEFKTMIQVNCSIQIKPITARDPRANSILERVHQTKGNIIRTFKVQDIILNNENTWDRILAFTIFLLCAMQNDAAHSSTISV